MSAIESLMKANGFTTASNPYQTDGFKTKTYSYGNSNGIILVNSATKQSNGKTKVGITLHAGAGWMTKDIFLTDPKDGFNTARQQAIIERRVARFIRKLG